MLVLSVTNTITPTACIDRHSTWSAFRHFVPDIYDFLFSLHTFSDKSFKDRGCCISVQTMKPPDANL